MIANVKKINNNNNNNNNDNNHVLLRMRFTKFKAMEYPDQ